MSVERIDHPTPHHEDKLREANHRISNHLTLIVGMVQMQSSALAKGPATISRDEARALLDETAGKITTVGQLHRWLAETPGDSDVELGNYLIKSCAALLHALGFQSRVTLAQKITGDCRVTPEQAQQIGLIVSEIIMNSAKHAHPTGLRAQVLIACHHDDKGRVSIEVSDDGVGLPEAFDKENDGGVGFKLIRSLTQSLGATLDIESDALGLCFRVTLPARGEGLAVAAS